MKLRGNSVIRDGELPVPKHSSEQICFHDVLRRSIKAAFAGYTIVMKPTVTLTFLVVRGRAALAKATCGFMGLNASKLSISVP